MKTNNPYMFFRSLVKNKDVAFVGLSPVIYGKKLGNEIDSHEVIIRSNYFPIPIELRDDYGKQCNVLALHSRYRMNKYKNIKSVIVYKNTKHSYENMLFIDKDARLEVSREIEQVMGENPGFATQGMNMMYYSLKGGCKSFKFYGITGYQNKNKELTDDEDIMHYIIKQRNDEKISAGTLRNESHKYSVLNDYLRLLLEQGKIEMDDFSKHYFT